jgi:hypothetical protein
MSSCDGQAAGEMRNWPVVAGHTEDGTYLAGGTTDASYGLKKRQQKRTAGAICVG